MKHRCLFLLLVGLTSCGGGLTDKADVILNKVMIENSIHDLPKRVIEKGSNLKILKKLNPWLISNRLTIKATDQIEVYLPNENEQLKPYKRS
jgi:hypothetical protein